ncbi:MAG TPA: GWxTD domain-containing protein [bacterium]|nr:GWxTD domain-containing protein [bacterium]
MSVSMRAVAGQYSLFCSPRALVRLLFAVMLAALAAACAAPLQSRGERAPLTEREEEAALRALLGAEKFGEYVTIEDTLASADWLRRFWTSHDPTPTTPENEFREEHDRRVYHAIYLFGSPGKGGRPWDDRGEVYIRYGQPDERIVRQAGVNNDGVEPPGGRADDFFDAPLNEADAAIEVWSYNRWNETFQFEDKRGFGFFELAPVTDPAFRRQSAGEFHSARLRAIDLQPAIYYHEYGRNLIDYALDVVRFRGQPGTWRLDINLGYPLAQLGRGPDSTSFSIRRTLLVRDEREEEVYSEVGIISRQAGRQGPTNQLVIEQKVLELPPGRYTVAATIEDENTGKSGTYLKPLRLPEYISPEIQEISDIELASFVWSIYEPGSPFIKNQQMVMPLPSRVYLPDQPLAFYFEVYHLLLDESGRTHYQIDYEISALDGDFKTGRPGTGVLSGSTREIMHSATLDIGDLPSGDYLLTVRVTDLVGKHEKQAVARFAKSS